MTCTATMLCLLCFCYTMLLANGAPMSEEGAKKYLSEYGYLDPLVLKPDSPISSDVKTTMYKEALTEFQNFYGLSKTGRMDKVTSDTMQLPRCGVKDKPSSRSRRSILADERWMNNELTFDIYKYPKLRSLSKAAVDEEMAQSLQVWANATNLTFRRVYEKPDLNISFFEGDHGDAKPFTGSGFALAHAEPPSYGMVHFDDEEPWSIRDYDGRNLFLIAVHEFGHALGLDHTNEKGAIMYGMFVRSYEPDFVLHDDDIQKIQRLYGEKMDPPPNLCTNSSFDAIFEYTDGIVYVMKGKYYWKLSPDGFLNTYPELISHRWPGVSEDVDAAIATSSDRTYLFKGNKYWAYDGTKLRTGHPRLISFGWPGIPDDIDGASWYKNNVFYFFKGDKYWIFDSNQNPNVDKSRPMTDWGKIVGVVNDVMYVRNDVVYFFMDGLYYRYNCKTRLVDSGWPNLPQYPRKVGQWWFRCPAGGNDK